MLLHLLLEIGNPLLVTADFALVGGATELLLEILDTNLGILEVGRNGLVNETG